MTPIPDDVRARILSYIGTTPEPAAVAVGDPADERIIPIGALMSKPEDYHQSDVRALHGAINDIYVEHGGSLTQAQMLGALEARSPELAAKLRWIEETAQKQGLDIAPMEPTPETLAHLRETLTAIRLMNAHREIKQLGAFLNENPGDQHSQQRVAYLVTFIRTAERHSPGAVRAWQAELRREGTREGRTRGR